MTVLDLIILIINIIYHILKLIFHHIIRISNNAHLFRMCKRSFIRKSEIFSYARSFENQRFSHTLVRSKIRDFLIRSFVRKSEIFSYARSFENQRFSHTLVRSERAFRTSFPNELSERAFRTSFPNELSKIF